MSQRGWSGVVALGLLLGLVVGGVIGYGVGVNRTDDSSTPAAGQTRVEPKAKADNSTGQQGFTDQDICNASDVNSALDVFGRNTQDSVSAATVTQLRKAGNLFHQASTLAHDRSLVAALNKLANVSLSVQQGQSYSFAAYNQFSTACSGLGL